MEEARGILNLGQAALGAIVKHGMDTLKLYSVNEDTLEKEYWIDEDNPPKVLPNGKLQVTLALPTMDGALWWEANAEKIVTGAYSVRQYKKLRALEVDEEVVEENDE